MNMYAYQQKALVGCVGVGENGRAADISGSNGVVCPKPRRLGLFNSASVHVEESIRPYQLLQFRNQEMEACDLKAGSELMDIILTKGNYEVDKANFEVASSPPFYYGSPPSRAGNPLIQDAEFGNHNFVPTLAIPERAVAPSPPPPSSTIMSGGGCVRVKFGNKPAPVRIEGFNCRGNCSVSAVA
ncbi:putative protein MOTHER of FT and TF 1-like [Capsicum annuum]|uniref:uncharacterized protein LOC107855411 n=1 Tax=Capsicum annuum TaxID=4072 RepID=UPI0007BF2B86|nr:uncharacterized protein LOC107855411 [Capsicum annuum]KAF3629967.1 putative protein MOTHER of FT and TF 1-like [Capsicum annuum]KAF3648410.1 putative protein MOTHER of FT and TF 1-like [Capsicum annuum]